MVVFTQSEDKRTLLIFIYCSNTTEIFERKLFGMEESCNERQEEELQALQAIYMDDFQDLREKVRSSCNKL